MNEFKIGDLVILRKLESCCGTTYDLLLWEVVDVGRFKQGDGELGVTLYKISNGLEEVYATAHNLKSVTG